MSIQIHFDKFHSKIKLSRQDAAYKKARERDDSITKDVKTSFKEAGYAVTSDFIQGSHSTCTAIVPLSGDYDIDRALVIDAADAPANPVEPKKNALDVLEKRGFKNAKIKKPCVTADYQSDNVHIDFAIYKKNSDQHYLAVGKKNSDENNREWSASDPRGLIDWVNDSSVHGGSTQVHDQFRRLVRYEKRWRDNTFSEAVAAKIFSIGLTVMVREQFVPCFTEEGFRNDLTSLRITVSRILDAGYFSSVGVGRYNVQVLLPVKPWRDIFHNTSVETATQFRNKLHTMKAKLQKAEALDDEREQCKILNELFGDDFVVPDSGKMQKAVYSSAGAVGHSQGA